MQRAPEFVESYATLFADLWKLILQGIWFGQAVLSHTRNWALAVVWAIDLAMTNEKCE